jgi:hypothetical protein
VILAITIDRTSLELDPLVIRNARQADDRWSVLDRGFALPTFPVRYSYAPDSDYLEGKELLGAVRDQGTMPAVLMAYGDSIADLFAAKDELEAALLQSTYTVKATLDGVDVGPWDAFPITPSWGDDLDPGLAEQFNATTSLQFLLNPPSA